MKDKLLEQLSSPDTTERRYAAEDLVERKGDDVIAALAKAHELVMHVQMLLGEGSEGPPLV